MEQQEFEVSVKKDESEVDERKAVTMFAFRVLKPVCVGFLMSLDNKEKADLIIHRTKLKEGLVQIEQKLNELPAEGIRGCFEYILFPLITGLRHLRLDEKIYGETRHQILHALLLLIQRSASNTTLPWTLDQALTILRSVCDYSLPLFGVASEESKLVCVQILFELFNESEPSSTSYLSVKTKETQVTTNIFDELTKELTGRQLLGKRKDIGN